MRVICINAGKTGNVPKVKAPFKLIEGETYTVLREMLALDKFNNKIPAYELVEMQGGGWERHRFIPLSNIDENEIAEKRETELLTQQ